MLLFHRFFNGDGNGNCGTDHRGVARLRFFVSLLISEWIWVDEGNDIVFYCC